MSTHIRVHELDATQNVLLLLYSGGAVSQADETVVGRRRAGVKAELCGPYASDGHAQVVACLEPPDVGVAFGVLAARVEEHVNARTRKVSAQAQRAVAGRMNPELPSPVATRWDGRADRGRIERRRGEGEREERSEGEHGLESHRECGRAG
jgi:hypothetical protein